MRVNVRNGSGATPGRKHLASRTLTVPNVASGSFAIDLASPVSACGFRLCMPDANRRNPAVLRCMALRVPLGVRHLL
ncbi:MAG: hypothetical protein ACREQZ_13840 [Woeseiaceae bacterium]